MGALGVALIVIAIIVFILVVIGWLSFGFNIQVAKGQFPPNNTKAAAPTPIPPPVAPTIVNTPTPTAPNPNFQYLPQKAYVQAYGPEIGVPSSGGQLQGVPVIQPAPIVQQPAQPAGFDIGSIMGILGTLAAGGAYLKGHLADKKAEKVEVVAKENSAAIVDSKIVEQEVARYMFNLDKAKADSLNDAPAIKLETLENNKKTATETATKA